MNLRRMSILSLAALLTSAALADSNASEMRHAHGSDAESYEVIAHAPIGIMGDHAHPAGGAMLALRYKIMGMKNLYDGSREISQSELLDPTGPYGYTIAPTSMTTQAVVASGMYAPSDFLTLSLMVPYMFKEMSMTTRMGTHFNTRSNGLGDIRLVALSRLVQREQGHLQLNLGLSFPSGSIDETDDNPMSGGQPVQLPYPMQLGSGTWDLLPAAVVGGETGRFAWGFKGDGVIRMTTNDNGYRLGHAYELTGWGEWAWTRWLATSFRLTWKQQFEIDGRDHRLPPMAPQMTPLADPRNLGWKQFNGLIGFQLLGQKGWLAGQRLAVEAGLPLWQSTSGPALGRSYMVTVGWLYAF